MVIVVVYLLNSGIYLRNLEWKSLGLGVGGWGFVWDEGQNTILLYDNIIIMV